MSQEELTPDGRPASRGGALGAVLALAAILVVLFWSSLFGGKVLTQADALNQFEPWASAVAEDFRPSNGLLLDQATGFLPWNDFIAEQLRNGELPLWCPLNYGGIPLVGTGQSAVYWPSNWLYFAFPSWHTYVWMALIILLAAGTFAFLYLRRLELEAGPAAVGALGYMLCGFLVVWLNHPQSHVALFLPALLWAIERTAVLSSGRSFALFGLLIGLQLLGGHPQTSLHIGIFAALYAVTRMFVPVAGRVLDLRAILGLGGAAVAGVLMAAPQLLPFVEYVRHSQALATFGRDDLVASEGVHTAPILMLAPDWFGAPHTHDYTGPLGPNLNYNELIGGYVGRVLLVLALLQAAWFGWRSKTRGLSVFFAASVIIAGLVAFQFQPFYGLFRSIPGLASTKLMRFLVFVAFGLAVLGAMGLQNLTARLQWRGIAVAAAFVLVAVEMVSFARGYNPEVDVATLLPKTEVAEFLRRETGHHRVVSIDNTVLKPNANVFERIPMLSGYDSIEDRRFTELVLRMTTAVPQFPFVSQIGAFNRVEAFPLFCLLGVKYFVSRDPLPDPLRKVLDTELGVFENPQVLPKAFLAREVRVIEDVGERLEFLSSPGFDPRVAVLEAATEQLALLRDDPDGEQATWLESLAAQSPGAARADAVEIVQYAPRTIELRVRARQRSLLVVNDVWDAGWSAAASVPGGGESLSIPIARVDHALRGIFIEPGEWVVTLRYDPWSTRLGLGLAALALAALSWVAFRVRPREP